MTVPFTHTAHSPSGPDPRVQSHSAPAFSMDPRPKAGGIKEWVL